MNEAICIVNTDFGHIRIPDSVVEEAKARWPGVYEIVVTPECPCCGRVDGEEYKKIEMEWGRELSKRVNDLATLLYTNGYNFEHLEIRSLDVFL